MKLLCCMGCTRWYRVLLKNVRPSTCYKSNRELLHLHVSDGVDSDILQKEMWKHQIVTAAPELPESSVRLEFFFLHDDDVQNLFGDLTQPVIYSSSSAC